jgi:hypothetical protein
MHQGIETVEVHADPFSFFLSCGIRDVIVRVCAYTRPTINGSLASHSGMHVEHPIEERVSVMSEQRHIRDNLTEIE